MVFGTLKAIGCLLLASNTNFGPRLEPLKPLQPLEPLLSLPAPTTNITLVPTPKIVIDRLPPVRLTNNVSNWSNRPVSMTLLEPLPNIRMERLSNIFVPNPPTDPLVAWKWTNIGGISQISTTFHSFLGHPLWASNYNTVTNIKNPW